MAYGYKTGGRRKGTPNKKTSELARTIRKHYKGFNPLLELIKVYYREDTDLHTKVFILKELAPYLYPKRKAIDTRVEAELNRIASNHPPKDLFERVDQAAAVFRNSPPKEGFEAIDRISEASEASEATDTD